MHHKDTVITTPPAQLWIQPWVMRPTQWQYPGSLAQMTSLAAAFDPISLKQMDGVALLNRIDTKFVMNTRQALEALANLHADYWMLEVKGKRLNRYRTLYFDTQNFDLYQAHVNDRPERYKVRSREYSDSNLSFLEVKHRTRKDRTIKDRIWTAKPLVAMTAEMGDWLHRVSPIDANALEPKLWNTFTRVTLVSKRYCERVTIDLDLAFATDDKRVRLDGIVVAEAKTDGHGACSPFLAQMRSQRIRKQGFSKYAIGIAMLNDQVKKNALKPKMLFIEKIGKGSEYYG